MIIIIIFIIIIITIIISTECYLTLKDAGVWYLGGDQTEGPGVVPLAVEGGEPVVVDVGVGPRRQDLGLVLSEPAHLRRKGFCGDKQL